MGKMMKDMDREPFVVTRGCPPENNVCITFNGVLCGGWGDSEELAREFCRSLNASVAARVKEEVEEAEKVWIARLAECQHALSGLVNRTIDLADLIEDGVPVHYLRQFMDEGRRKAMEEFREKAALALQKLGQGEMNICENTSGEHGDYSLASALLHAAVLVKDIPTEPEGKK